MGGDFDYSQILVLLLTGTGNGMPNIPEEILCYGINPGCIFLRLTAHYVNQSFNGSFLLLVNKHKIIRSF